MVKKPFSMDDPIGAKGDAPAKQDAPAKKKPPAEKRIDPADGCAYTYAELLEFHAGQYKPKALEAYWRDECWPEGKHMKAKYKEVTKDKPAKLEKGDKDAKGKKDKNSEKDKDKDKGIKKDKKGENKKDKKHESDSDTGSSSGSESDDESEDDHKKTKKDKGKKGKKDTKDKKGKKSKKGKKNADSDSSDESDSDEDEKKKKKSKKGKKDKKDKKDKKEKKRDSSSESESSSGSDGSDSDSSDDDKKSKKKKDKGKKDKKDKKDTKGKKDKKDGKDKKGKKDSKGKDDKKSKKGKKKDDSDSSDESESDAEKDEKKKKKDKGKKDTGDKTSKKDNKKKDDADSSEEADSDKKTHEKAPCCIAEPQDILKQVAECKVIPVVGIEDVAHTVPLCNALVAGGINVIEIVFRTACALDAIKEAVAKCEGICVGAGTVLTQQQAAEALDAGASFIVSPGFDASVANLCRRRGALYLPGCVTPTEVMRACSEYKLKALKFFPAGNYGGVGTLKSFAAVFSDVTFMPTGGVSEANIGEFTALPNVIACGGSWITKDVDKCAATGDWSSITEVARKARAAAGC